MEVTMKHLIALVLTLGLFGAQQATAKAEEACESYTWLVCIGGKYLMVNEENPAEQYVIDLVGTSVSNEKRVWNVQVLEATEGAKQLPENFQFTVHNVRSHPWTTACRAGFDLADDLSYFQSINIQADSSTAYFEVMNPNACQGWFCNPATNKYRLEHF
jgi:hypothetical protein